MATFITALAVVLELFVCKQKVDNRVASLFTAVKQFRQAKSDIWATITEDQIRLLKIQAGYQQRFGSSVMDSSLNDTMKLLLTHHDWREFDDLAKKFKVPERRYIGLPIAAMIS